MSPWILHSSYIYYIPYRLAHACIQYTVNIRFCIIIHHKYYILYIRYIHMTDFIMIINLFKFLILQPYINPATMHYI